MTTLHGSCHCGSVAFEAETDGEIETSRCDCSICRKSRFWKTMVPAEAFMLTGGGDALADYRFGSGRIGHRFCRTCGVKVFGTVAIEGTEFVAINVACLDLAPEALAALPVTLQDGRHDAWEREPTVSSYL